MIPHFSALLAGDIKPAGRLEVRAAFDQSLIAEVDSTDTQGVEQALSAAHAVFRDRSAWLPARQRISILEKTAELMAAQREFLAVEAAREGGKPLQDSRVEVTRAIDSIRLCSEALRTRAEESIPTDIDAASTGKQCHIINEPIGVVVAVSAFNHPLNLIAHQVGPAVAAGCPVIVKPSQDTPLSCLRLVALLHEAGLPRVWCQALVTDSRDAAEQLVTDARVAFFSFIGSAKVGWMLRSKLAPGTRCALEHGGVAPVIVAADAEIEKVIPKLLKGGFYHAGQVCVSVQRIYVHESLARDLAERLARAADALRIGDPTREETEVGPLIRPAEVQRVAEWVDEAVVAGTELLAGGKTLSDSTYACTVLYDPSEELRVSREEIFGPVVCIYPYRDLDQAIRRANSLPWAFQAAVFTAALKTADRVVQGLDASTVMINEHTAFRVDWMPFAGLRQSGLGTGGIPYTFHDMQVRKLVVNNTAF